MGKRSRTADALEAALPFRPAVWDISVKCRGLGCRRHMTHRPRDLREVLSFGKEAFFVRYISHALAIGCLGIAYAILQDSGRLRAQVSAFILVTAGFGYIAFALWRRWNPGEPTLALSPDGIRFRFTKRHTFVIPWDDVQAVASADIRIGLSMIPAYERNVPVIFVSESFYRDRIFLDSLWQKDPAGVISSSRSRDLSRSLSFMPCSASLPPTCARQSRNAGASSAGIRTRACRRAPCWR